MGYQAHCIVMEEISKASGSFAAILSRRKKAVSDLPRQYRIVLRRTFPTLHKPIMPEWEQGSKREVSPRLDRREEDRGTSYVGTFGGLGCREYEKYGESCRRWIPAQWY